MILLLLVLPAASILVEGSRPGVDIVLLTGKWFVFWSVGVRLFLAGARQTMQPKFTAAEIFDVRDPKSFAMVREIGFGNLSMGLLGLWSLARAEWMIPAAIAGGVYYGLAGAGHILHSDKNAKEWTAMVSDGFIFIVLLVVVSMTLRAK